MIGATQRAAAGAIAALSIALAVPACDREDEGRVPAACKSGKAALRSALAGAPRAVSIEGTRLSDCLARTSDAGDIQAVGATWVAVAVELARGSRAEETTGPGATRSGAASPPPRAASLTRLGYLVGAARRGAARTQGIHDELIRRLEQELVSVDRGSVAFREGERAGRTDG